MCSLRCFAPRLSHSEHFMRTILVGSLALAVTGIFVGCVEAQRGRGTSPQEAARHGWLNDYREAKDRARQTGKPIMLVFRCIP